MRIKFLKSPTGLFKLAYSKDNEADVNDDLAKKIIAKGYAIEIDEPVKKTVKRRSK